MVEETLQRILTELQKPKTTSPYRAGDPAYKGSVGALNIYGKDTTAPGLADGNVHCVSVEADQLVEQLTVYNPGTNTGSLTIRNGPTNTSQTVFVALKGDAPYVIKHVSPSKVFFQCTGTITATDVFYVWWGG